MARTQKVLDQPPTNGARHYSSSVETVIEDLKTNAHEGLSSEQFAQRLAKYGPNRISEAAPVSDLHLVLKQFANPVMLLLLAAMLLSLFLGDHLEAAAIGAVLLINAMIGFLAERRAVRSINSLKKLNVLNARVMRDGAIVSVAAHQLVPGDVVILEAGDHVPADMRVARDAQLSVDESVLTGESLPVAKAVASVDPNAPLYARSSMLFRGTGVLTGSATGIVTATGTQTELGQIAQLVTSVDDSLAPLEKNLGRRARQLIWLSLGLAMAIGALGIASGVSMAEMAKATIALTIATIPEGLPIVATLALARGLVRMAQRNALVRTLGAAETLGSTTVIMTDKTGTLTENLMTVDQIITLDGASAPNASDENVRRLLTAGVLCANADFDPKTGKTSGDPLEVALISAAENAGLDTNGLRKSAERVREVAFDSQRRLMATVQSVAPGEGKSLQVSVKGAPEAVIAACTLVCDGSSMRALTPDLRERIELAGNAHAARGYKMIALACKSIGVDQIDNDPYSDLELLGIAALRDPPRADVKPALEACHDAGIRLIMITGDHPATANAVAQDVGFNLQPNGDEIAARVSPGDKLKLIVEQQEKGEIVAMTGDGVNDAPALSKADIGIAMGKRGTDVARDAADMVLLDDAFPTIVAAVREGRVIFRNIRRICIYLLSCNLGEVLLIALALAMGLPLPLLPLQILFLNMVTDVFPAFALAMGDSDKKILKEKPRPAGETILERRHWSMIGFHGTMVALGPLLAFWVALVYLEEDATSAATIAFLTIGLAQLWHSFSMREASENVLFNSITSNLYIWASLVLCTGLLLATVYFAPLALVLNTQIPDRLGWALIGICSFLPLVTGQLSLVVKRMRMPPATV